MELRHITKKLTFSQIFELLQYNTIIFDYYDFSIRFCTIRFTGVKPFENENHMAEVHVTSYLIIMIFQ